MEVGHGNWPWKLALEIGPRDWPWKLALEIGPGSWPWNLILKPGPVTIRESDGSLGQPKVSVHTTFLQLLR